MILKEGDECGGRQAGGGFTTRFAIPEERTLALVGESLDQATAQLIDWTFGIVRIIAVLLAGDQHVQRMVDIVIPLRGVGLRLAVLCPLKVTGLVAIVFQDQVDVAIRLDGTPHCIGQFREDVGRGVVNDRVNRVQSKSVEVIFGQPVQGIVDEEVADDTAFGSIEIDAVCPRESCADR